MELKISRIWESVAVAINISLPVQVEEMEVDDFYDGIKRLYNEDVTTTNTTAVQEGAKTPIAGGGVLPARLEGRSSPCPPLQPASAS